MRGILRAMAATLAAVCAVVAIFGLASGPVWSEQEHDLTFRIKSSYRLKVQVAFYSQNRDHSLPGPGRAYDIDNYRKHEYTLRCRRGERICYGGWVEGDAKRYWGVGLNNRHRCETCCYVCNNNETRVIDLD